VQENLAVVLEVVVHACVQEDLELGGEASVNGWDGVRRGLVGGVVGAVVSGAPSTVHALATGGGVLTAARAAGGLLGKPGLGRGLVAHAGISLGWGAVLGATLPRRRTIAAGAAAGLAMAALDLGVVGRRIPEIAALPVAPQVLDHIAFGAVVGATVAALD
jgi:hypothetical protein